MQELKNRAIELLKNGTVARVLGWRIGENTYDPEPAFFDSVEAMEGFVYNNFCAANLSKYMIEAGKPEPLQTNDHRCAFGHFYYAVQPKNPEILAIWKNIREQHKEFHANGDKAIAALKNQNLDAAREFCKSSERISEKLLKDFEEMVRLAEELEKKQIRVFE